MLSFPQRDTIIPARGQQLNRFPDDVDTAGPGLTSSEPLCFSVLDWAPGQPLKMGIKHPPLPPCSPSPPLKLGVFVMVIGSWQNSWITSAPPSPPDRRSITGGPSATPLGLSLQIRDGGSCGNMEAGRFSNLCHTPYPPLQPHR